MSMWTYSISAQRKQTKKKKKTHTNRIRNNTNHGRQKIVYRIKKVYLPKNKVAVKSLFHSKSLNMRQGSRLLISDFNCSLTQTEHHFHKQLQQRTFLKRIPVSASAVIISLDGSLVQMGH